MAHKGYTVPYFINFFENIPDHRWTEGRLQEGNTVQKCALGHALSDARSAPNSTVNNQLLDKSGRVRALESILENNTANINDGACGFRSLGKTPRGRILRALRNVQRTGNVHGKKN